MIQRQNWQELRRLYSNRCGSGWIEAWEALHRADLKTAVSAFQKCFREPQLQDAAFIVLWKLGSRPSAFRPSQPKSLKYYHAYLEGELRPLVFFLKQSSQHLDYAAHILERVYQFGRHLKIEELELASSLSLDDAEAHLRLGQLWDHRLRKANQATRHFDIFFRDPWVQKALEESRRLLFDEKLSQRVRFAYSQRDGLTLKRLFSALEARISKLNKEQVSDVIRQALHQAVEFDRQNVTLNMLGYPFWKVHASEWSAGAAFELSSVLFQKKEAKRPPFLEVWSKFFESDGFDKLPIESEPDELSLWQVAVENKPLLVSKALLKFPNEERFLHLWSNQTQDKNLPRSNSWPANESESKVLRSSLERAFQKSSNKLLWFDRLRQWGCSQSFYEYALQEIDLPVDWVLQDLESNFIEASTKIRQYLTRSLSTNAPGTANTKELSAQDLKRVLRFLAPAEHQEILISRYVLMDIPLELLNDDQLELLWDARNKVGSDVWRRWLDSGLQYIQRIPQSELKSRHWVWIKEGWKTDLKYIEAFAPQRPGITSFPWQDYLDAIEHHGNDGLLALSLHLVPFDHLRFQYSERLLDKGFEGEAQLLRIADLIHDEFLKNKLLSLIYTRQGKWAQARPCLEKWYDETPLLIEKSTVARLIFDAIEQAEPRDDQRQERFSHYIGELKKWGGLEANDLARGALIATEIGDLENCLKWRLEQWSISSDEDKLELLPQLLDSAFRARQIDETQRLLIDYLFSKPIATELNLEILNALLSPTSVFRIKHLRKEFVQKSSAIFPLNETLLKKRAEWDYRAVALWEAITDKPLEAQASLPSMKRRKNLSLWNFTQLQSRDDPRIEENLKAFDSLIDSLPAESGQSEQHEFLNEAERILTKLAKKTNGSKKIKIRLKKASKPILRFHFDPDCVLVDYDFFNELDADLWSAISLGYLQVRFDRSRGLYSIPALIERFFQGMLLSGIPIGKQMKLFHWLALAFNLVKPSFLKDRPADQAFQLPVLSFWLSFFLSEDFERKMIEESISIDGIKNP